MDVLIGGARFYVSVANVLSMVLSVFHTLHLNPCITIYIALVKRKGLGRLDVCTAPRSLPANGSPERAQLRDSLEATKGAWVRIR